MVLIKQIWFYHSILFFLNISTMDALYITEHPKYLSKQPNCLVQSEGISQLVGRDQM